MTTPTPIRLSYCIYCGNTNDLQRDHVIPSTYTHHRRTFNNVYHVTACGECNRTLSDHMFITVANRAAYLATQYKIIYKDLLKYPVWSTEDLRSVSPEFRVRIKTKQKVADNIRDRLKRLSIVAAMGEELVEFDERYKEKIDDELGNRQLARTIEQYRNNVEQLLILYENIKKRRTKKRLSEIDQLQRRIGYMLRDEGIAVNANIVELFNSFQVIIRNDDNKEIANYIVEI